MIVGGVELITLRNHGGLWFPGPRLSITATLPGSLPPNTVPGERSENGFSEPPSTQRFGTRAERDLATRITLGLWALYIPNLIVSTGFRVLAWGTGSANTQEGSVPGSWGPPVEGGSFGPDYIPRDRQVEKIGGVVYGPPDW